MNANFTNQLSAEEKIRKANERRQRKAALKAAELAELAQPARLFGSCRVDGQIINARRSLAGLPAEEMVAVIDEVNQVEVDEGLGFALNYLQALLRRRAESKGEQSDGHAPIGHNPDALNQEQILERQISAMADRHFKNKPYARMTFVTVARREHSIQAGLDAARGFAPAGRSLGNTTDHEASRRRLQHQAERTKADRDLVEASRTGRGSKGDTGEGGKGKKAKRH